MRRIPATTRGSARGNRGCARAAQRSIEQGRVATDVGGTFADLVYLRTETATGTQEMSAEKTDTAPPNFDQGVLDVMGSVVIAGI